VRTATSDDEGFYTATNLPVGTYSVAAERAGFKRATQSGITVTADARLTVGYHSPMPGQVNRDGAYLTIAGETVNTTQVKWLAWLTSGKYRTWALNGAKLHAARYPLFPARPSSTKIS